jgi:hypothetical protein
MASRSRPATHDLVLTQRTASMVVVSGLFILAGCPEEPMDTMMGMDATAGTATDTGGDLPGNDCTFDMHDPNDSRAAATSIDANMTMEAKLCTSGDEADWWTFSLSESSYVGVEVLFAKDGQDVALELWDGSNGMMIDRSQGGADIQATHQLLEPGRYEVFVERLDGDPTYTLKTYALSTATPPAMDGGATRVRSRIIPRASFQNGSVRPRKIALMNLIGARQCASMLPNSRDGKPSIA